MVSDMRSNALDRNSIAELILGSPPLIESYLSLGEQLQPNGFDLSLKDVSQMTSGGNIGSEPDQRKLSDAETLEFDRDGWLRLSPGPYLIKFNEVVNLPLNLMALGRPRSSLLRSGVSIHTAVWDAGYRGRSQALLVIHNNHGYDLRKDARLMQLIFFHLTQPMDQGYQGRFLGENL